MRGFCMNYAMKFMMLCAVGMVGGAADVQIDNQWVSQVNSNEEVDLVVYQKIADELSALSEKEIKERDIFYQMTLRIYFMQLTYKLPNALVVKDYLKGLSGLPFLIACEYRFPTLRGTFRQATVKEQNLMHIVSFIYSDDILDLKWKNEFRYEAKMAYLQESVDINARIKLLESMCFTLEKQRDTEADRRYDVIIERDIRICFESIGDKGWKESYDLDKKIKAIMHNKHYPSRVRSLQKMHCEIKEFLATDLLNYVYEIYVGKIKDDVWKETFDFDAKIGVIEQEKDLDRKLDMLEEFYPLIEKQLLIYQDNYNKINSYNAQWATMVHTANANWYGMKTGDYKNESVSDAVAVIGEDVERDFKNERGVCFGDHQAVLIQDSDKCAVNRQEEIELMHGKESILSAKIHIQNMRKQGLLQKISQFNKQVLGEYDVLEELLDEKLSSMKFTIEKSYSKKVFTRLFEDASYEKRFSIKQSQIDSLLASCEKYLTYLQGVASYKGKIKILWEQYSSYNIGVVDEVVQRYEAFNKTLKDPLNLINFVQNADYFASASAKEEAMFHELIRNLQIRVDAMYEDKEEPSTNL